jgi:hypothetical protein
MEIQSVAVDRVDKKAVEERRLSGGEPLDSGGVIVRTDALSLICARII